MAAQDIIKKRGNHTRRRTFAGVRGRAPQNHKARCDEALDRLKVWQSFGPAKQLEELDRRLGKGAGAKKQRARIQELLSLAEQAARPQHAAKEKHQAKGDRK